MTNFNIQYHDSLPMHLLSTFPLVKKRTLDDYEKGNRYPYLGTISFESRYPMKIEISIPRWRFDVPLEDTKEMGISQSHKNEKTVRRRVEAVRDTRPRSKCADTAKEVKDPAWGAFQLNLNRTYPSKFCVVPIPVCHLVRMPYTPSVLWQRQSPRAGEGPSSTRQKSLFLN